MPKFQITPPGAAPVIVEAPTQYEALSQVLQAHGPDVSSLGSFGRGVASTVPLGEQAYAGVAGVAQNEPYAQERKELTQEIAQDKEVNPGSRFLGQATGVVAPAVLTGGASLPEELGGVLGEGALIGSGFGAGNAIDTKSAGGSNAQAAADVALGAGTGVAGGALGELLGKYFAGAGKNVIKSVVKSPETDDALALSHTTPEELVAKTPEITPTPEVPQIPSGAVQVGSKPVALPTGSASPTPLPVNILKNAVPTPASNDIPTGSSSGPIPTSTPQAATAPLPTKQGLLPSADELKAEILASQLGGSPRQLRALPGKNPVDSVNHMFDVIKANSTPENPLISATDRFSDRLTKFNNLADTMGHKIGNELEKAKVPPLPVATVSDAIKNSMEFPDPAQAAHLQSVADKLPAYGKLDGNPATLTFKRLQQLKTNLGKDAFGGSGGGDKALQSAYFKVRDLQDSYLQNAGINTKEFQNARDAYHVASTAIPMLKMATSRSLAKGYASYGTPLAALMTGHPIEAAKSLLEEPVKRALGAVAFHGAGGLDNGAKVASTIGYKVAGAVTPSATQASSALPNLEHPALAKWKQAFDKAAQGAKNPAEVEKAHAVTDYTLQQNSPEYAAARAKAAEDATNGTSSDPLKMADGGVVAPQEPTDPSDITAENKDDAFNQDKNYTQADTEPVEQRIVNNLSAAASGYSLPKMVEGVAQAAPPRVLSNAGDFLQSIPAKLSNEAGALFPEADNGLESLGKASLPKAESHYFNVNVPGPLMQAYRNAVAGYNAAANVGKGTPELADALWDAKTARDTAHHAATMAALENSNLPLYKRTSNAYKAARGVIERSTGQNMADGGVAGFGSTLIRHLKI